MHAIRSFSDRSKTPENLRERRTKTPENQSQHKTTICTTPKLAKSTSLVLVRNGSPLCTEAHISSVEEEGLQRNINKEIRKSNSAIITSKPDRQNKAAKRRKSGIRPPNKTILQSLTKSPSHIQLTSTLGR